MTAIRTRLAEVARRARDAGRLPPDADPEVVAMVMMSLVTGWIVQRHIAGVADRTAYFAGVRAVLGSS
jgi:hypothetical protein